MFTVTALLPGGGPAKTVLCTNNGRKAFETARGLVDLGYPVGTTAILGDYSPEKAYRFNEVGKYPQCGDRGLIYWCICSEGVHVEEWVTKDMKLRHRLLGIAEKPEPVAA